MLAAEVDYVARNTAYASLGVAILALFVAAVAAIFARQQAQGQRAANTPEVTARTSNNVNNRPGVTGSLGLTFTARDQIKKAVVTIRKDSDMIEIGSPEGGRLGRKATITDIPLGVEVVLPGKFVDGKTQARITVTMKGPAFGKRTLSIDPTPYNIFVY